MDHSQAHVLMFDREHVQASRIKSRSHHRHQGEDDDDGNGAFLVAMATALAGTHEVLLTGPGLARKQFHARASITTAPWQT